MNATARTARRILRNRRAENAARKAESTAARVDRIGFGAVALELVRAVPEALAVDLTAEYSLPQVDRALELIADGAIVPGPHGGFISVSSDGLDFYATSSRGCSCPAGLHGTGCYHVAAARLLAAA